MTATVITARLFRVQAGHGHGFAAAEPSGRLPVQRPARVAVMLALAHTIERAIVEGQVHDQAEVARRLGFTRARLTQLLRLLRLAPDLQERVLFLEAVDGIEPLTERELRGVTCDLDWATQRLSFGGCLGAAGEPAPS